VATANRPAPPRCPRAPPPSASASRPGIYTVPLPPSREATFVGRRKPGKDRTFKRRARRAGPSSADQAAQATVYGGSSSRSSGHATGTGTRRENRFFSYCRKARTVITESRDDRNAVRNGSTGAFSSACRAWRCARSTRQQLAPRRCTARSAPSTQPTACDVKSPGPQATKGSCGWRDASCGRGRREGLSSCASRCAPALPKERRTDDALLDAVIDDRKRATKSVSASRRRSR